MIGQISLEAYQTCYIHKISLSHKEFDFQELSNQLGAKS